VGSCAGAEETADEGGVGGEHGLVGAVGQRDAVVPSAIRTGGGAVEDGQEPGIGGQPHR
jgi:hypothetical protein